MHTHRIMCHILKQNNFNEKINKLLSSAVNIFLVKLVVQFQPVVNFGSPMRTRMVLGSAPIGKSLYLLYIIVSMHFPNRSENFNGEL